MSMEIPYTVEARPDTGLNNGKLGIWLFLASEVMLFGALFASYVMLRVGRREWPRGRHLPQHPARDAQHRDPDQLERHDGAGLGLAREAATSRASALFMGITILCGFGFLIDQVLRVHGQVPPRATSPSTNTFLAIYFTLTGLHGLHVIGGMAVNGYLWGPGSALWKTDPVHFTNRVENAGLFWHLVDLVWIFLFPVLYLL